MHDLLDVFSDDGKVQVAASLVPGMLLAFDFDGTLAPIVVEPGEARPADGVEEALHRLRGLGKLAIITGRSVSDVDERLDCEMDYVVGNHGIEWRENPPGGPRHQGVAPEIRNSLENWARHRPGVVVESKGYSLSVHYRLWPGTDEEFLAEFMKEFSPLSRFVRFLGGKRVVNVLPHGAPGKGWAVQRLLAQGCFSRALFLGDDLTDNDVFELEDPRILSVGIGLEPGLHVRLRIPRQAQVADFLDLVADFLKRKMDHV